MVIADCGGCARRRRSDGGGNGEADAEAEVVRLRDEPNRSMSRFAARRIRSRVRSAGAAE